MDINYTDRWNELCYLLSENIARNMSEEAFEKVVLEALRVLEWKRYQGDIEVRQSYPIGASKSLIPDIILKGVDKRKLFVIEIKQPALHLSERIQHQLFSYMRQLKLEYGILIGQVIQIFYDGDLIKHDVPVLLETIPFEKNNPSGIQFARLFSKDGYNFESLNIYTFQAIEHIRRAESFKLLLQKITSDQYIPTVIKLIKHFHGGEYDEELLDSVLEKIDIRIIPKLSEKISLIENETNLLPELNLTMPGKLQIQLIPDNDEFFRKELLKNGVAYVTRYYKDGSRHTREWRVKWLKENSSIMGNLRSNREFRNGEWQKLGIVKVRVTLDKDSVPD